MYGRDPSGSQLHPFELFAGAFLGGLGLLGLWSWATATLAGAVLGEARPALGLAGAATAALRLPEHLSDPRLAYDEPARSAMPGPVGWWIAATLVSIAFMAVAAGVGRVVLGARRRRTAASWAGTLNLRKLYVRTPVAGRITLGRHGRHLVAAERGQSVLVVAPTQSGKTTGLAIPALLEWHGPVLATSVKTDLLRDNGRSPCRRARAVVRSGR